MEPPRLIVFSTPLIATWVLDETHRILFDAGDGCAALLEGKIHKANYIALTHAHRDHIAGLPQLLNLRGGVAWQAGTPLQIFHPEGSGSLIAMGRFLHQFDHQTAGHTEWHPLRAEDQHALSDDRFLRAFTTHHIPDLAAENGGPPRTLGYHIGRHVDRLKAELRDRPQAEIDRFRTLHGREAIIERQEEILFTISGDTRPLPPSAFAGTRFLLHECTFLDNDEESQADACERGHAHSCLSEVLDSAQEAEVMHLGLYHISKRYTDEEIIRTVRTACARRDLKAKVSVALPGRIHYDLFSQTIWPLRKD